MVRCSCRTGDWTDGSPIHVVPDALPDDAPQPALEAYRVSRAIRDRSRDDYTLLEPAEAADAVTGIDEKTATTGRRRRRR